MSCIFNSGEPSCSLNSSEIEVAFVVLHVQSVTSAVKDEEEMALVCNMKSRRVLKGHRGKLLHFDWSMDKNHVMTAGQVCEHLSISRCMYKMIVFEDA